MSSAEGKNLHKAAGRWLREQREQRGLTAVEVAETLGMSRGGVSSLETIGTTYRTLRKHAETLGWDIPTAEALKQWATMPTDESTTTLHISPIPASAGHGTPATGEEITALDVPISWMRKQYPTIQNLHNLGLCQARGESMNTLFDGSDTLLVDMTDRTVRHEGIYVFTFSEGLYVKLVRPGIDGLNIISTNPAYPPWRIPAGEAGQVTVHGRVIGKWVGFTPI